MSDDIYLTIDATGWCWAVCDVDMPVLILQWHVLFKPQGKAADIMLPSGKIMHYIPAYALSPLSAKVVEKG